jgi:hypothetical protein
MGGGLAKESHEQDLLQETNLKDNKPPVVREDLESDLKI